MSSLFNHGLFPKLEQFNTYRQSSEDYLGFLIRYSEMDQHLLECNYTRSDEKEGNKIGEATAKSRDEIKVNEEAFEKTSDNKEMHGKNGIKDKNSDVSCINFHDYIDKEKDDKVVSSDEFVANNGRAKEDKNDAKGTPEDGELHDRQEFIDDGTLLWQLFYESGKYGF